MSFLFFFHVKNDNNINLIVSILLSFIKTNFMKFSILSYILKYFILSFSRINRINIIFQNIIILHNNKESLLLNLSRVKFRILKKKKKKRKPSIECVT